MAVAILALAVAGLAAALEPASGRDGFNGTIVKATGSFAGARGAAAIQLFPTRSAGNIRTMTL